MNKLKYQHRMEHMNTDEIQNAELEKKVQEKYEYTHFYINFLLKQFQKREKLVFFSSCN